MQSVFNILEREGLIAEDDTLKIDTIPRKKVVKLYENVYSAILESQSDIPPKDDPAGGLDPFTFLAGGSLRGESSCSEPLCRLRKLDFLARYSALYATEVTVPLPLEHPSHVTRVGNARTELSHSALTLIRLRPLITEQIVRPVVMRSSHCKHTLQWVNDMVALVHDFADDAARRWLPRFKVVYQVPEKAPTGRSTIYLTGPEDFVEHGYMIFIFDEDAKWRSSNWRYNREGKVQLKGGKKLLIVKKIFREIANNTTFYLAYGRLQKARFLTDRVGETFVLDWLTRDTQLTAKTSAMEHFIHSVPILLDLPIATIIRIRLEERDSFESYRRAVARIASNIMSRKTLNRGEAKEMFRELIEPELVRLNKEIRSERKRQTNRILGGLASLAAGVSIGAFGGLPIAAQAAIGALGALTGNRLLGKAAEVACEHGASLRQQNDFYFLLKLLNESPGK